jgi:hypothetical protein
MVQVIIYNAAVNITYIANQYICYYIRNILLKCPYKKRTFILNHVICGKSTIEVYVCTWHCALVLMGGAC